MEKEIKRYKYFETESFRLKCQVEAWLTWSYLDRLVKGSNLLKLSKVTSHQGNIFLMLEVLTGILFFYKEIYFPVLISKFFMEVFLKIVIYIDVWLNSITYWCTLICELILVATANSFRILLPSIFQLTDVVSNLLGIDLLSKDTLKEAVTARLHTLSHDERVQYKDVHKNKQSIVIHANIFLSTNVHIFL